jgi:tRNA 2-thiouridine synthesizing protein A
MSSIPAIDSDEIESDDSRPLGELDRLAGGACADCRVAYSSREAVFSIVLGFKNAPRCLPCLSQRLGRDADDLGSQLVAHIHRRDCFLRAWREAERRDAAIPADAIHASGVFELPTNIVPTVANDWDAGDMGCGELVMALRLRMNDLPAGAILKVTATDPAAPEDLPAWCRMSGHTLVAMNHPNYFIRRKGD